MKHKIIPILTFIMGAIIFGSIGIYAASEVLASQIRYKDTTVDAALDDIYSKIGDDKVCIFISNQYGNKGQIGAKYACNPGDGKIYYFYLLAKSGNQVKLILEKNITDSVGSNVAMSWSDATQFFNSGHAGYATAQAWNRVSVDLPNAVDIVNASLAINPKSGWSFDVNTEEAAWFCLGSHEQDQPNGPTFCPTSTAQQNISWLFNYTRSCSAAGCSNEYTNNTSYPYGYWTKDLTSDPANAWGCGRDGNLFTNPVTTNKLHGVRPVITISASEI